MVQNFRDSVTAISQIIIAVFSSIIFLPLSLIIPKKKARIIVISRHNGLFIDNAKYLFLYLCDKADPEPDVIFLVFNRKTYSFISAANLPVCIYPGLKSILYLLTANLVVVDSAEWLTHGKFQLAFGSKIVQLWHGAPLKQIELPLFLQRIAKYPAPLRSLFKAYKFVTGRHAVNELVVSTSTFFTEKAFRPAFNAKRFVETGYPRNDVLFTDTDEKLLDSPPYINTDIAAIKEIMARKKSGAKILLYAPTFRKELDDPFSSKVFDLERMEKFSQQHNFVVVLKLHPVLADKMASVRYANIINYNTTGDIYPALNLFDALITDYSSIYFDFLLLDRPVIFYPYDYDNYIRNDRSLLFEYEQIAPGQICMDQDEVENATMLIENDPYMEKRKEVRDLVFTYKDGNASARLWQVLKNDYIAS